MKTEIEAKFLNVDFDDIRQKLRGLGAVCEQPMRLMRRTIVQNEATGRNSYIRLRDEGDRVTLTYKMHTSLSVDGTQEVEVTVSDFDATRRILEAAGLEIRSFQESRRETWRLNDVEVVLDEWPWLRPYIEIEADSETRVRDTAALLGFAWEAAVFGDIMVAYRAEYPHMSDTQTIGDLPTVGFGGPLPDMLQKPSPRD